jgi:hypothetical protein
VNSNVRAGSSPALSTLKSPKDYIPRGFFYYFKLLLILRSAKHYYNLTQTEVKTPD